MLGEADARLTELLCRDCARDLPRAELAAVLEHAERHGLGGVIHDLLNDAGAHLESGLELRAQQRALARDLDHGAHLRQLDNIDETFAREGIAAVALKGPLLAERLYASRPSARATTDTDILVAEEDLERAIRALERIGYVPHVGPEEDRFRREHHHLHLDHPEALPLELHFHAYRGFGSRIPSRSLIERCLPVPGRSYGSVGVLSAPDELVYLAVHAAAHRFMRLAWLWDIKLLLAKMRVQEIAIAGERARAWGYRRVVAFAADRLVAMFGVERETLAPLGEVEPPRRALACWSVSEPSQPLARAATRFIYTTSLCDTPRAAASYALAAILYRVRHAAR